MKDNQHTPVSPPPGRAEHDPTAEMRMFASWMGLLLVAFGTAMAGYMFYRIGMVVMDPRSFETQVDRWEFVIRGRTTDAFPDAYETPERTVRQPAIANELPAQQASPADSTEEMARFVGRVGSKSARPAALLLIVLVLTILLRIAIAIIHAGIRLAGLAGGEREYMKRIVDELVNQRGRHGD
jgi:hypothetical protein